MDNIGSSTIRFGTYGRGVWDFEIVSSVLPVELLTFSARLKDENAQLHWTTASELNTDNFEVQHSTNGSDFKTIGSLDAFGNNSVNQTYDFVHESVSKGVNYYRLKINDEDSSLNIPKSDQ